MLHHRLRAAARSAAGGAIPTDGLMAWYKMDTDAGGVLVDSLAGINGTISGATIVGGVTGNALQFDGVNDIATVNTSAFSLQTVAVSFWINTNDLTNTVVAEVGTDNFGWSIQMMGPINFSGDTTPGCIGMTTRKSGTAGAHARKSSEVIAGTGWRHCVLQRLAGVDVSIHIDAVNKTGPRDEPTTIGTATYNANRLTIGARFGNIGPWPGVIDQMRIYNRQLTQQEITALYNEV